MKRGQKHKHGHDERQSPEYAAWQSMKHRCYTPSHEGWTWVGGRGVEVCARWLHSFENFLADVGRRPSPKHQLNRIEKKQDYTPSNTRWALAGEVGRTRAGNRFLTVGSVTLCLEDWAKKSGIAKGTLHYRLAQGMTMRDAIDLGRRKKRRNR